MKHLAQNLRQTITQTRLLSHGLAPVSLEADGLMNALHELALGTSALAKIECEFHCKKPFNLPNRIPAMHLYRIAQEAVNNALRHGQANHIEIRIKKFKNNLQLSIKDNGKGFLYPNPREPRNGIKMMHYRAEIIGASISIQSKIRKGTNIICAFSTTS